MEQFKNSEDYVMNMTLCTVIKKVGGSPHGIKSPNYCMEMREVPFDWEVSIFRIGIQFFN